MAKVVLSLTLLVLLASQDLPRAKEFRALLLRRIKTYPTDGRHGYFWPRSGSWLGTTRDLYYQGRLFAKGDPKGRSYCTGITFEVFFLTWREWCQKRGKAFTIGGMDLKTLRRFQKKWYVADGDRRGAAGALEAFGLGKIVLWGKLREGKITLWAGRERIRGQVKALTRALRLARAGDFVQFWRANGTGHSAVFLAWVRKQGKIFLRYWSSQRSTKGIGVREEELGKIVEFYIGRVGR